jgi:hypothetical protein
MTFENGFSVYQSTMSVRHWCTSLNKSLERTRGR